MPNPWEQDWSKVNTGGTGNPWEQDWSNAPEAPQTIQEQHPDITIGDRLIVKNLATSPEAAVSYIKKQHPNLQVELDPAGEIKVKRPEEQDFRVLDPSGITSFTEALKDVGDIGYDVISGGLTGAATAAGGLAGAAGGGVGALPGAAAAGAGASGLLESLRQAAGSAAGIEENIDPSQIALATGFGGVSPIVFGTGATAAQAAKQIAQRGLTGEAAQLAEKALMQQQAGLPSKGLSAITKRFSPGVAGFFSGEGTQAIKDLSKNLDKINALDNDEKLIQATAQETYQAALDKVRQKQREIYKELADSQAGKTINIEEAIQPWLDKLEELNAARKKVGATDIQEEAYQNFKKEFSRAWTKTGEPIKAKYVGGKLQIDPNLINKDFATLEALQNHLANLGDFTTVVSKADDAVKAGTSDIRAVAKNSYGKINDALERSAEGTKDLKSKIKDAIKSREYLNKSVGTPEKFVTRMNQASGSKTQNKMLASNFREIDKMYGTNLDDARSLMSAYNRFNKDVPWYQPGKMLTSPAGIIGGALGYGLTRGQRGEESPVGTIPGYALGAGLGSILAGPRAIRAVMERAGRGGMVSPITQRLVQPAWNIMQTTRNQRGE